MKTKEYVLKYNLDKGVIFNHQDFVNDLTIDFVSLLEIGKSTQNIKGFENAVRAINMKYNAICNKMAGVPPEKLWNFFYATVVVKTREKLFPEIMKMRKEEREERERFKKEYYSDSFADFFFWGFLLDGMLRNTKPVESFKILELQEEATAEDVKNSFRKLSFKHHPDHGGNQDKFIELVEAKNKLLAFLS